MWIRSYYLAICYWPCQCLYPTLPSLKHTCKLYTHHSVQLSVGHAEQCVGAFYEEVNVIQLLAGLAHSSKINGFYFVLLMSKPVIHEWNDKTKQTFWGVGIFTKGFLTLKVGVWATDWLFNQDVCVLTLCCVFNQTAGLLTSGPNLKQHFMSVIYLCLYKATVHVPGTPF